MSYILRASGFTLSSTVETTEPLDLTNFNDRNYWIPILNPTVATVSITAAGMTCTAVGPYDGANSFKFLAGARSRFRIYPSTVTRQIVVETAWDNYVPPAADFVAGDVGGFGLYMPRPNTGASGFMIGASNAHSRLRPRGEFLLSSDRSNVVWNIQNALGDPGVDVVSFRIRVTINFPIAFGAGTWNVPSAAGAQYEYNGGGLNNLGLTAASEYGIAMTDGVPIGIGLSTVKRHDAMAARCTRFSMIEGILAFGP
jgi:hypothetical protein